ncbi:response regulator transcription factor [Streptomyces virginiae]|uniref:response regulator transcription factor n=1 Tax=Streptomyces virginiae TaxID=1961 RepID=UPI00366A0734
MTTMPTATATTQGGRLRVVLADDHTVMRAGLVALLAHEPTIDIVGEALGAVADGLSNAEIGRRLFIGEATVKTHRLRIFAKLDVGDRTRAVVVAMNNGLLRQR